MFFLLSWNLFRFFFVSKDWLLRQNKYINTCFSHTHGKYSGGICQPQLGVLELPKEEMVVGWQGYQKTEQREKLCRHFKYKLKEEGSLKNEEFPQWIKISLTIISTLFLTFSWHLNIIFMPKRSIVECHFLVYSNAQDLRKVKKYMGISNFKNMKVVIAK